MYYYLPYDYVDINTKRFYINFINECESYILKKEDYVDTVALKIPFTGYLILDEIAYAQIKYLNEFIPIMDEEEYVNEMNTSIIEKFAKQILRNNE